MEAVSLYPPRWAIWCDYQITRRKRYHAVKDPEGRWIFESRVFWECVEYLDAQGITEYRIVAGGRSRLDCVQALAVRKEQ